MAEEKTKHTATVEDIKLNKTNAILSYLGIFIIVPLLSEDAKKSKFATFHMNQGFVLSIAGFISSFIIWVPVIGWAAGIFMFILWMMGLIGALQGKMKRVPLLGNFELIK